MGKNSLPQHNQWDSWRSQRFSWSIRSVGCFQVVHRRVLRTYTPTCPDTPYSYYGQLAIPGENNIVLNRPFLPGVHHVIHDCNSINRTGNLKFDDTGSQCVTKFYQILYKYIYPNKRDGILNWNFRLKPWVSGPHSLRWQKHPYTCSTCQW